MHKTAKWAFVIIACCVVLLIVMARYSIRSFDNFRKNVIVQTVEAQHTCEEQNIKIIKIHKETNLFLVEVCGKRYWYKFVPKRNTVVLIKEVAGEVSQTKCS